MQTFDQARHEILRYLTAQGWTVVAHLKTPHATAPGGRLRLWFKPQAVHFTQGDHHELGNARTISYDLGIRTFDGPGFLEMIRRRFRFDSVLSSVDEEEEEERLEEGDYVLSGTRSGNIGVAEVGGKFLGSFKTFVEVELFIIHRMDKEKFYPNVWQISDRGNVHAYLGTVLRSRVGGTARRDQ